MRIALAATLLAAAWVQAAPVAFIADIRGNATIEGNGRLTFLAELAPGTRLLLGTNAAAAIAYAASGSEYAIAGPGQFLVNAAEVVAERGAAPRRRAIAALADPSVVARVAQTATASLRMRGLASLPPPALEYPVSARIATLKPALRWGANPSQEYSVALFDSTGREIWKARAASGVRPDVTLAAATRYSWAVTTPASTVGRADFETLPVEAIRRAETSRARARTFADRVLHALLLHELGAAQEAREAWADLARERPDLPELASFAR